MELTTPAYPGETFRGTVQTIATEAEFTPKNTQTEQGVENTVFKVKVSIEDSEHKLRAGMTMQVTLDLGQVK
jgi:HlyD family secretion protein